MNNKRNIILTALLMVMMLLPGYAKASGSEEGEGINVKEILFEHLGDGYGWEVPFSHSYRIPLPVIVRAEDGSWHCFSSARLTEHVKVTDPATGKEHTVTEPRIVELGKDGEPDHYKFLLAHASKHKDKVVQLMPTSSADELEAEQTAKAQNDEIVDGYVKFDGKYYKEYKPWDLSITKNVMALFISVLVVLAMVFSLVGYYRRNGEKAPRKGMGFMEMLVEFIYDGVIKSTLHGKAKKYVSFLLTCFFFIFIMNLLGLIVVFPGGANLTGNIAVTLVLAVIVFVVVNVNGTKHYWKEIFWPDVPLFLKFPLPIMQFIEIFGIFTKPAALCVRLFANMMGGHMIVITLTLVIFIFAMFGAAVAGASAVLSVIFSLFMLAIDVLVSFIQAYVFTLLATIFISMSDVDDHAEAHKEAEIIDGVKELG